jgi:hypothetical protein
MPRLTNDRGDWPERRFIGHVAAEEGAERAIGVRSHAPQVMAFIAAASFSPTKAAINKVAEHAINRFGVTALGHDDSVKGSHLYRTNPVA